MGWKLELSGEVKAMGLVLPRQEWDRSMGWGRGVPGPPRVSLGSSPAVGG